MTKWGFVIGTCVALGLPLFMLGKRERRSKLTAAEWVVSLVVLAMAIAGLIGITTGQLTL